MKMRPIDEIINGKKVYRPDGKFTLKHRMLESFKIAIHSSMCASILIMVFAFAPIESWCRVLVAIVCLLSCYCTISECRRIDRLIDEANNFETFYFKHIGVEENEDDTK